VLPGGRLQTFSKKRKNARGDGREFFFDFLKCHHFWRFSRQSQVIGGLKGGKGCGVI